MGMIGTRVYLQLRVDLTTEFILGQHASDSNLDNPLRVLGTHIGQRHLRETTRVARVAVVHLGDFLVASDCHLVGVDNDDVIPDVDVRSPDRIVFTPQQLGNLRSQPSQRNVVGIDYEPLPRDICGFGRVGLLELGLHTSIPEEAGHKGTPETAGSEAAWYRSLG